jgi:hypothetical protein
MIISVRVCLSNKKTISSKNLIFDISFFPTNLSDGCVNCKFVSEGLCMTLSFCPLTPVLQTPFKV